MEKFDKETRQMTEGIWYEADLDLFRAALPDVVLPEESNSDVSELMDVSIGFSDQNENSFNEQELNPTNNDETAEARVAPTPAPISGDEISSEFEPMDLDLAFTGEAASDAAEDDDFEMIIIEDL